MEYWAKHPFFFKSLNLNYETRTHTLHCDCLHDLMCILKASTSEQPPHHDSNDATVKRVGTDFSTSHSRQPSVPTMPLSACESAPHVAQMYGGRKQALEDGIILVLMMWNNMIWNMQCFIVEPRSRHAVIHWGSSMCVRVCVKAASWQFAHARVWLCRCMTLTWLLEWEADQKAYTF